MTSRWTPERTQKLRAMWAENKTGGEIAVALRMSRGAVLGKVNRLGLNNRNPSNSHPGPKKPRVLDGTPDRGPSMSDEEYSLPSFIRGRINIDSLY